MSQAVSSTQVAPRNVSVRPFLWAALLWLGASASIAILIAPQGEVKLVATWLLVLYAVSLADLIAIARLVSAVFELMSEGLENRGARIVQASYWGFLKLACLGIFTILVFKGQQIPATSLFLGVGTMVFVPVFGGFLWSKGL